MNRPMPILLAAIAVMLVLAGCGADDVPVPDDDPGVDDALDNRDPGDAAEEPRDDETDDAGAGAMEISGSFTGDPQLEGGCAWVEAPDGERYEVLWPDGYEVSLDPVALRDPAGEVVATDGDTVTVHGAVAEDLSSFCMVGTIFRATQVDPG